jgi:hypothetical protein
VSLFGPDLRLVKRVSFQVGKRRAAVDPRAPFTRRLRVGSGRNGTTRVRARVLLVDGRRVTVSRRVRPCSRLARGGR